MGHIPADATLWDSGDWLEWHRNSDYASELPCAAGQDQGAQLTVLQASLLRAAQSYHALTEMHLDIYPQIARVHAALHFGIPLIGGTPMELTGVHLVTLAPDSDQSGVSVDLAMPFTSVLVVRIDRSFAVEGRMITRRTMGQSTSGIRTLKWRHLPKGR